MSYAVKLLADSRSAVDGTRITTFEVTFPRFILAEVNTHRVLSRNSASSRAIPTEKIIERVQSNPFVPETFNRRVKGMGVGDVLPDRDQIASRDAWLWARDKSLQAAHTLLHLGVDKSRVNRLLEPWLWHTAIITATEWRNFYALRTDEAAQPEFKIIADEMLAAHQASSPVTLEPGEWHLPLVDSTDVGLIALSAGRCARVSYDKHNDDEEVDATLARYASLTSNYHLSPTEHQATPFTDDVEMCDSRFPGTLMELDTGELWSGNLKGWFQHRKEIPHEWDASRVWGEDPYGFL